MESEARFNQRMKREQARFDKWVERMWKLLETARKLGADVDRSQKKREGEFRKLRKSQRAYFASLRRGQETARKRSKAS